MICKGPSIICQRFTSSTVDSWIISFVVYLLLLQITLIQSLIGCTGRKWLMGVISQLEEGHFYLEDLTAAIPIDLANAISFLHFFHVMSCYYESIVPVHFERYLISNNIFVAANSDSINMFIVITSSL